jgi:DNA/RNA endonuclease YhcR with UshA esterase domain
MKKILFICTLLFVGFKSYSQTNVPAKEAAKHLNEKVTICDKIYGGKFLSGPGITLIDVGGSHPDEALTLLIKGDDRKKFKSPPEELFKDKKVCITGTVVDYKGKPEIIITEADQIKIVE